MGTALLVDFYNELPQPQGEDARTWETRRRAGLEQFKEKVAGRYTEGTLHRLLATAPDVATRRAVALALGMVGTMRASNALVAELLHDRDRGVRHLATDALWALWFRGDTEENNRELQRVLGLRDRKKKWAALDALIARARRFAEAYNQRAILYFRAKQWQKSAADCERVLKLNPYHFGAAAGLGQCQMQLEKYRAALKAFRQALRINPALANVQVAIHELETALGEEGRRDDKK